MKFDHDTICKPVLLRELLFYKSVNEDLKQFTPKYHGRQQRVVGDIAALVHNEGPVTFLWCICCDTYFIDFNMYNIIRSCWCSSPTNVF